MLVIEHRILSGSILDGDDFSSVFFLLEENSVKAGPAHDNAAFKRHFMYGNRHVLKLLGRRWVFGCGERVKLSLSGNKPVQFNWD